MIMQGKNIFTALAALCSVAFLSNCGDDKESEKSVSLADLNPPGTLYSVTRDGAIELRWTAVNAEDDFKGYFVFGTKAKIADLTAGIGYPADAADKIDSVILARCAENNGFFTPFGFEESSVFCDDANETEGEEGDDAAEEETEEESEEEALEITNFLQCDGQGGEGSPISVMAEPPALDLQTCVVKQVWDADQGKLVDIENGGDYVFFVMAVMGDDLNEISWTSNILHDVPSIDALNEEIEISEDRFVVFTIEEELNGDILTPTFTVSAEQTCPAGPPCALGVNAQATNGIYLARDSVSGNYQQRLFISTSSNAASKFLIQKHQAVRDQDLEGDGIAVRAPRDQAEAKATYPAGGTAFTAFDNNIFDFVYTASNGEDYYGKIVFPDVTAYAGDAKTGKATVQVNIVMQPKPNEVKYFQ